MLLLKSYLVIAGFVVRDCFGSGVALRPDVDTPDSDSLADAIKGVFEDGAVVVKNTKWPGTNRMLLRLAFGTADFTPSFFPSQHKLMVTGCVATFCFKSIIYKFGFGLRDEEMKTFGRWSVEEVDAATKGEKVEPARNITLPTQTGGTSDYLSKILVATGIAGDHVLGIEAVLYSDDKRTILAGPVLVHRRLFSDIAYDYWNPPEGLTTDQFMTMLRELFNQATRLSGLSEEDEALREELVARMKRDMVDSICDILAPSVKPRTRTHRGLEQITYDFGNPSGAFSIEGMASSLCGLIFEARQLPDVLENAEAKDLLARMEEDLRNSPPAILDIIHEMFSEPASLAKETLSGLIRQVRLLKGMLDGDAEERRSLLLQTMERFESQNL